MMKYCNRQVLNIFRRRNNYVHNSISSSVCSLTRPSKRTFVNSLFTPVKKDKGKGAYINREEDIGNLYGLPILDYLTQNHSLSKEALISGNDRRRFLRAYLFLLLGLSSFVGWFIFLLLSGDNHVIHIDSKEHRVGVSVLLLSILALFFLDWVSSGQSYPKVCSFDETRWIIKGTVISIAI